MKPKMKWLAMVCLVGLVLLTWVGCATSPEQKIRTCEQAQAMLAAYQVAVDTGVVVKPEMIAAGKIAAAYLAGYCGWTTPKTRGGPAAPALDKNGVLIVHPPG